VDVLQVIYYTNDAGRPIVKDWIDNLEAEAIILHGINKKSQDIPANDIKTAIKRFKNFVRKR